MEALGCVGFNEAGSASAGGQSRQGQEQKRVAAAKHLQPAYASMGPLESNTVW
jgi:hypothetical protein